MPYPLQKSPAALLGAMDLKTLGSNPDRFSEMVSGVIDVEKFYLARNQQVNQGTGNVQNFGSSVSVTVPDGQAWLLYAVSAHVSVPAGCAMPDGIALQIRYALTSGALSLLLGGYDGDAMLGHTMVANGEVGFGVVCEKGLLLQSGGFVQLAMGRTVGAVSVGTVRALAAVIPT